MISLIKQLIPKRIKLQLKNVIRSLVKEEIGKIIRGKPHTECVHDQNCPCYCVVCSSKLHMFYPFNHRHFARCPFCNSLERHRLLWYFLENEMQGFFLSPIKLLHIAPEKNFFSMFSSISNIEYVPADLSPNKYPGGTIKMDCTDIQYPNNTFDAIIANHVLEHIPDDARAMRELYRVLKPFGWAILNVPLEIGMSQTDEDASLTNPRTRLERFGQSDHFRLYGKDYLQRLQKAGFNVRLVDYFETMDNFETFKYGFKKNKPLVFCRKDEAGGGSK